MAFLSGVSLPGGGSIATTPGAPPPTGGGFLGSIQMPTATSQAASAKSAQNASLASAAQVAQANAKYANSFPGMAWNAAKGIWTNILKPTVNEFGGAVKQDISSAKQNFQQGVAQSKDQTPGALGTLNRLSGIATALSSPLAGTFNPLSTGITAGEKAVSNNPTIQRMASKLPNLPYGTLGQVAGDIGNIAGTLSIGAGAFTPIKGGFLDTAKTPEGEDVVTKLETPTTPEPKAPVKSLVQTHAEYARSQGYEPYSPNEKLPTIQMGEKAKPTLPTVQANAPESNDLGGGMKLVPEKPSEAPVKPSEAQPSTSKPEVPYSAEKPQTEGYKPLTPAESTGKVEQSTLASKVDANAVARKLTDSLGDLPEYNKVNMKEQAQFASDLVENEPDKAMRIAMGEEPPPPHILPEAVFTALEDKATRAGDVNTLRQLGTKSNLSLQATAMGQRIRALGERDSLSPTGKIREVAESRASRATPDKIKGAVDSIKGEIKKARTTSREDWSSFVQRITCNS